MSTQLIPVFTAAIGDSPVNAVDARKLHEFLNSKRQFSNWIAYQVDAFGFTQDVDYVAINNSDYSPPRKEYYLTIGMAKELAMVERNAKGKQARQYFIECERRAMESQPVLPRSYADALRLYADQVERNEQQQREIEASRPKIAFHDQVVQSETVMDFAQMFSLLQRRTGQKFSRATFLSFARRHGFACQPNPYKGVTHHRFVPRADYIGTWFVSEMHPNGVIEWMVRPMAIAGIVALIEFDRSQSPLQNDSQEAA